MRTRISALVLATSALAACATPNMNVDEPARGLAAVNVPVVARTDYVFDAAAPDGYLSPAEQGRLDAWFRGLELGYGDSVYIDGAYAGPARDDVARIAGQYGMLMSDGAPMTVGAVAPGAVRVIVSRTRATVPNCPNWDRPATPDYQNRTMPNFGCGVNSNLAAMVADPRDLVYGREDSGLGDAATASKAIGVYRSAPTTGAKGLQDINTKKDQ